MHNDLIERLQKQLTWLDGTKVVIDMTQESADAIEKLEADLVQHRELLVHHLSVIDPLRAELATARAAVDRQYKILRGLQWEIESMKAQKPVARIRCWTKNDDGHSELIDWEFPGIDALPDGEHLLYAAPGASPAAKVYDALPRGKI